MKFLRRNKGQILFVFALNFCTLTAAPLSVKVLSSVLENIQNLLFPMEFVLLYIGMKCFQYCGAAISEYQFRKLELSITEIEEKAFYDRLSRQPLHKMAGFTTGGLLEKFALIKEYAQKMLTPMILIEEFLVSVLFSVLFLMDLKVVNILYIMAPILLWCIFSVLFQKKLGEKLLQKLEKREKLRASLAEMIGNLESILAFNRFSYAKKEFQKQQEQYREKESSYVCWEEAKQILNQTTIVLGKFVVLLSFLGTPGNVQAELISGFLLIDYLYQPVFLAQNIFQTLNERKIHKKILERELEELTEKEERSGMERTEQPVLVEVEHISYSYGDARKDVLHDVSLTIPTRGCGMFVGRSGAGKSTLLNVIVGILRPKSGTVCYGEGFDKGQIAYMEQFPAVFSMSVKDNLCLGRKIPQSEMEEICKQVQIHETIQRLPNGYDTILAEGGKDLSGGQIQRIVLARTLLRKAKLIILDEPTSALDPMTEKQFWEMISKRKETESIVVITHDPKAVEYGDYVYQL